MKRLFCGELLGGKRCFAEILTITPLGDSVDKLLLEILMMNSAGDRKNFAEDDLSVAIC